MIEIGASESANLIAYFTDFSTFLFFLLEVLIFLGMVNLILLVTKRGSV